MTDTELTIFGRPLRQYEGGPKLTADVGLFIFYVEPAPEGFFGWICYNGHGVCKGQQNTQQESIDWLESEARRIAREMIEMAGPMVARREEYCEPNSTSRICENIPVVFK